VSHLVACSCCGTELAEGEGAAVGCCSFSCCGAELAEVKEPQLVVARSPVAVLSWLRGEEAGQLQMQMVRRRQVLTVD